MEQLPKFELIEKYNEETAKAYDLQAKVRKQVSDAQAQVNALNFRYEQALKAAILDNAENEELVDELSQQLQKAKRDLESKKKAQQIVNVEGSKRTVTKEDLERELRVFEAMFQKEYILPSLEELYNAKKMYIEAFLEYMRRVRYFEEAARSAFFTANPNYKGYSIPYSVGMKTMQEVSKNALTDADLKELERGLKPRSI